MPENNVNSVLLYLDLMKRCLTNTIYSEFEYRDIMLQNNKRMVLLKKVFMPLFQILSQKSNIRVVAPYCYDENSWLEGLGSPEMAHTMIGFKRLENLQYCVEEVIRNNVAGDLIETGVWKGGATIFMRAILKAYGVTDRKVWVADSFKGLPIPNVGKYPQDKEDELHLNKYFVIPLEQVKNNFKRYELLDEQVCFLVGWFKDTLPNAPIQKIAVMRLDADLYESTMDALIYLYDKLSVGGFVIIDDYNLKGARAAVQDFRNENSIQDEIFKIDRHAIYWMKSRPSF